MSAGHTDKQMLDKLPLRYQLENAFMQCGKPVSLLALCEFLWHTNRIAWRKAPARGKQCFLPVGVKAISIEVWAGGYSCAGIMTRWWDHGIDYVLANLAWTLFDPGPYGHIGLTVSAWVASNQHWLADCLLRQVADTSCWRVASAPVYDNRRGLSTRYQGRPWASSWGVSAKPRSFEGGLSRLIGGYYGRWLIRRASADEGLTAAQKKARAKQAYKPALKKRPTASWR